ncbi:hypothetical protein L6R53_04800 [Myxococcota bacterium]|nr:hypothetical protein [Myxococcota bacterium]
MSADTLPEVVVSGRQPRDLVEDCWTVLLASEPGRHVFRFGSALVRVPDAPGDALDPLDPTKVAGLLHRVADWVRETERGPRPARVPPDIARDLCALPDPVVPRLTGLTPLPVLRRDGTVLAEAGYDAASGLFCRPLPALAAACSALPEPAASARAQALALLRDDLLGDFPFARPSDAAHALALVLLPLVRHLVDGPTPLHLIEAPSEGTGKTLLADVVHALAAGAPADPTPLPTQEEEVRKKITALLLGSPAMVLLDNVNHTLDSSSLAATLTKDTWSDRVLGKSALVSLPNRAVWVATGNNPSLSRELARRSARVRLDARVERPWLRGGFRHADLLGWTLAERPRLVAAALTLARGWLADGAPAGEATIGSFGAWSAVVGGILASAGVQGFLDDRDEPVDAATPEESAWQAFVASWAEAHGAAEVDGRALLALAVETGLWVPDARGGPGELARFGIALAKRRDRVFGGWRIGVRRDGKRKVNV